MKPKPNDLFTFFLEESEKLQRYAMSRAREVSKMDAEDIVSEVMMRMLRSTIEPITVHSLPAYVFRAIRNLVIDRGRKECSASLDALQEEGFEVSATPLSDPESRILQKEEMAVLENMLADLPEEYREILIATEIDGRGFKELSEEWNVPIGTLLSRKSRALQKMREQRSRWEKEDV
ncbi:MAG: RNA polymerase sigma factor [Bacillota bacterium]|nr:RNA polymerase sigma factor [Bacillota bacterium]